VECTPEAAMTNHFTRMHPQYRVDHIVTIQAGVSQELLERVFTGQFTSDGREDLWDNLCGPPLLGRLR